MLGGTDSDTITAGSGDNVIVGDDGVATFSTSGLLLQVLSTDTTDGGVDTITTLGGSDHIVGGYAGDDIDAGEGDNIVLGDSGQLDYATGSGSSIITSAQTTAPGEGDGDDVVTGAGDDIVLGGTAGDEILAGSGDNIIVGDDGAALFSAVGVLRRIDSAIPSDGGIDIITTLGGSDHIIGGRLGDVIDAGDGNNVVLGDDGSIIYDLDTNLADIDLIESTSTTAEGGADTIDTGSGHDIVIGGRYGDEYGENRDASSREVHDPIPLEGKGGSCECSNQHTFLRLFPVPI